jgi:hypothetical protein
VSWTFTVTNPEGITVTATIRNAEFNDVDRLNFRQGRGITEGGLVYVQDLDGADQFVDASWGFLTTTERADLEAFFGRAGTLRQARPFSIDITGSSFPQALKAGMIIGGAVVQAGDGLKTGQTVNADVANLRDVFLDQSELAFDQERDERFSLDLRFRIHRAA